MISPFIPISLPFKLHPSNFNYMRKFAEAWLDRKVVQEALAQITNALPDELKGSLPSIGVIEAELGGEEEA